MSNPAIPIPELNGSELASDSRRAELTLLQAELESRDSSIRFARAGVALVISTLVGGAAAKLLLDAARFPYAGLTVAAVAGCLVLFALFQFVSGRSCLARELSSFARLKVLHRELKLDDPSSLLPKE